MSAKIWLCIHQMRLQVVIKITKSFKHIYKVEMRCDY